MIEKCIAVGLIVVLWIGYIKGHDTKPVPKYFHSLINGLFFAFAVVVWVVV